LGNWGRQYINAEYGYGINDSPFGNYDPNMQHSCSLIEPFNLTYFTHAYLSVTSLTALENNADFGYVQISTDQINWETKASVTGLWEIEELFIDLDPYLDSHQLYLRFLIVTDGQNEYQGWFIDNVAIHLNQEMPPMGTPEEIMFPKQSQLLPNYPNPFNPSTVVQFQLEKFGPVKISIIDILGKEVVTLLNKKLDSGNHSLLWNGKDSNGKSVESGIYFIRMHTGEKIRTKKITLVK